MMDTVRIDYWDLVSRSVKLAWKHKFLWFFGFFASAGGGNVGQWTEEGGEWVRDFFYQHLELLVLIAVGVVILWLVFLVMNIISTGGLIRSISDAGKDRPISFGATWRAGLGTFWRLLGLSVLAVLTFLVVSAVCLFPIIMSVLGGAPGVAIAVLIGAVLFVPYIAFLFLLAFTVTYAEREIVLFGADVFDALREGWGLTKRFLWKSMGVWLVMLLSGLVYGLGLVIALAFVAIPFVLIGMGNLVAGLVLGIPVALALVVVATGAYTTFAYSVWTKAYETLKGAIASGAPAGGMDP
jgi:membrane-anchored glycerophosphoryl diester phosphodiesterase (GDPDase)